LFEPQYTYFSYCISGHDQLDSDISLLPVSEAMKSKENTFDVIIIGSGMGALSAASILSQMYDKRVLILERHFKPGGFTHGFKRKSSFHWDVGVHYVGEMQAGSHPRAMFDYITKGQLGWNAMPDVYDVFDYPDMRFEAHVGAKRLQADLIDCFPQESEAIAKYFLDIKKCEKWLGRYSMSRTLSRNMKAFSTLLTYAGRRLVLQSTKSYMDAAFTDPKLKAILCSQWGDYGLPPSQSAFGVHALIAGHYMKGAYYPEGGSGKIAETILPIIESTGGQVLLNHEVQEILIKHKTAYGVRVVHTQGNQKLEKEFFAKTIISDAGAYTTYTKLIPDSYPIPFRDEVRNSQPGTSNVTLYLGLKESPSSLGIEGENYWLYSDYDHDSAFESRNEIVHGNIHSAYLSFPSMKDSIPKGHTAEIIGFCDFAPFSAWAEKEWKNRGDDYEEMIATITNAMEDFVEQRIPGFKDLVEYSELSTPLSSEHFTGHREGSIYGVPPTPDRFNKDWIGIRTPVKNLFITGADAVMLGIVTCMISGALTAGTIMGASTQIMKIFKTAIQYHEDLQI
jgi:phytoene dehydrogenase-like protein